MPKGTNRLLIACYICLSIFYPTCVAGRQGKSSHKGRGRHFLTAEEVRQTEEKRQREKEWKVQNSSSVNCTYTSLYSTDNSSVKRGLVRIQMNLRSQTMSQLVENLETCLLVMKMKKFQVMKMMN